MKSSAKKVELASVDDLFSTEESRADAQREKVLEIPLSELHTFKEHPFKVKDDEAMMETADSIRQYGVLVPAIARPDPNGGYELVAGHRRHRASELAGKDTMPVIVRDLDDDQATIIMVDSNLQRESLLPSERAFAYKMKLEAVKHQGARTDLTSRQLVGKLEMADVVGEKAGDSGRQVQRYIRLTELIPELLDINYQLSQNEDKTAIFEGWCDFLNYFDSSIRFQLSFLNLAASQETFANSITIPAQGDDFDPIRVEYTQMLQNQLARGNNGLIKTKYLTFSIEADSIRSAKPRLERIETDVLNNFKRLGVAAEVLDGKARLAQLHAIFHMDEQAPFQFEWDWLAPSGLSTKDFIAPSGFEFRTGKQFRMGKKYGAVSFVQILAPELNDRMLADFLDMESSLIVNLHIQSVDQVKAIKTVKRKITDLDRSKIEEQKKAVRAGYDMDIIPSDLATYGAEAKKLLQDLQSRNERMFLVTFLVLNTADNPRQLGNNIFQASSIAQKYNCQLTRLDFQQEEGLMSSLPLGLNQVEIQRGLTTSSTAIFVPFTTQELFQNGKEALYYGINALSNNLIMVDRKLLKNPNGLILGTPGSGKSFSAKREIANCFLLTSDDVIICDPEAEYAPLVERLHGQVIKISPTSTNYINPMDLNLDYSDDESPLSLKSDFILSLCELIVGGKDGLQPVQKTIIDRCVRLVYQDYLNDPRPENMPILEDLYDLLRAQDEKEAQYIATALEIYVTGSLNVFNHRSNVDINNRIVCYDIKELGKQLKKIGMLVVQDQVWNRVTINRAARKSTRYYIDEMHLLLKEEQTAAYTVEIWKRFRKWGGIPTGITQNVKDLLSSREVENIFENSDFVYMLNQAGGDRQILARQLGISPHQLSYVTHSGEGEGLLFYGSTILPFVDHFPKNTELYRIMTTKPQEMKEADGR